MIYLKQLYSAEMKKNRELDDIITMAVLANNIRETDHSMQCVTMIIFEFDAMIIKMTHVMITMVRMMMIATMMITRIGKEIRMTITLILIITIIITIIVIIMMKMIAVGLVIAMIIVRIIIIIVIFIIMNQTYAN